MISKNKFFAETMSKVDGLKKENFELLMTWAQDS